MKGKPNNIIESLKRQIKDSLSLNTEEKKALIKRLAYLEESNILQLKELFEWESSERGRIETKKIKDLQMMGEFLDKGKKDLKEKARKAVSKMEENERRGEEAEYKKLIQF